VTAVITAPTWRYAQLEAEVRNASAGGRAAGADLKIAASALTGVGHRRLIGIDHAVDSHAAAKLTSRWFSGAKDLRFHRWELESAGDTSEWHRSSNREPDYRQGSRLTVFGLMGLFG